MSANTSPTFGGLLDRFWNCRFVFGITTVPFGDAASWTEISTRAQSSKESDRYAALGKDSTCLRVAIPKLTRPVRHYPLARD